MMLPFESFFIENAMAAKTGARTTRAVAEMQMSNIRFTFFCHSGILLWAMFTNGSPIMFA